MNGANISPSFYSFFIFFSIFVFILLLLSSFPFLPSFLSFFLSFSYPILFFFLLFFSLSVLLVFIFVSLCLSLCSYSHSSFYVPPFSVLLFLFLLFLFLLFLFLLFLFLFFSVPPFILFQKSAITAKVPYRQRQASSQILCPLSQSTISVRNLTRHASLCLLHCRLLCKL